jgi:cysteine desulfurase / selenocysteine lyase
MTPLGCGPGVAWQASAVRRDFPILRRRIRTASGRDVPITYMDHGASTHAPRPVIEAVVDFLEGSYANIHRGNHTLSLEASERFDEALATLLRFVGGDPRRDVAVPGTNTTTSLDLAAHVMAGVPGKTLVTASEHHSNDLPHRRRGKVVHTEVDADGRVLVEDIEAKLAKGGVKLVAVTGASNVTGAMPPIHRIARLAHDAGARILVDAAQLYAHAPIAMKPHGHPEHLDFVAAAGHKAYAPLGSSVLVGPRELLDAAPPYMPGGGTVEWVTDDDASYSKSPDRHMGGTPNIVGAIAFAAATDYLSGFGMEAVRAHEEAIIRHALKRFADLEEDHGVRLLGPREAKAKVGVFSFLVPGVRHEVVAAALDHEHGIATRNGCFCAHPLLYRLLGMSDADVARVTKAISAGKDFERPGATRASLGLYNTAEDVDLLCDALAGIASGRMQAKYEVGKDHVCRPVDATLLA